jgi:hypothetical protein
LRQQLLRLRLQKVLHTPAAAGPSFEEQQQQRQQAQQQQAQQQAQD